MLKIKTVRPAAFAVVLGLSLSACGGLGEGVQPVSAVIQPFGGLEGAASTKAFVCVNTGISLFVDFSNGSRGDFTTRARYTSSNPAVARVSNFDIAVPEASNSFYSPGVIVPVAAGTTTITANYLTFTRSIELTVDALKNFTVTPARGDLAVNSRFDFSATAELNGVDTPLDALLRWSVVTPNTAVATIDATTGTVTGVAAGGELTARARIPGCEQTADAPFAVANLQSLALSREFGAQQNLVVGTSELLFATGTLDNGKTQDLSGQVSYTTSDVSAVSLATSGVINLATAIKASTPVQLAASFANPAVTAPAIGITPVAESLSTIAVTPATVDVAAGRPTQFRVTGSYASGATQDITRHVSWTSSDANLAAVQTSGGTLVNLLAGQTATSTLAGGKTVTITATSTNAAGQSINSVGTLNIK